MQLRYTFDPKLIELAESSNEGDIEFHIRLLTAGEPVEAMKRISRYFESNDIHTDVLVYRYPGQEYRVIVKQPYYADFVLQLMKEQLLLTVSWQP